MNSEKEKTIYLHVGTHKTGSSAIQWTLRGAQQHLIDHGFDCIQHPHKILDPILGTEPVSDEVIADAKAKFDTAVFQAKSDKVIVSYELIFGQPELGYPNNAENLNRMKHLIGDRPCKTLIFLRRQDYFVESHYVQMVKTNYTESFDDYLNELTSGCLDWNKLVGNYGKMFDQENLKVMAYQGNVVDQFYEYLGIPMPEWDTEKGWQKNPSVSLYGMELKRRCNSLLATRPEKVRLKYLMVEFFPRQSGDPFDFFSGSKRLRFLEAYKAGNDALERRHETSFFPDNSDIDPDSKSALDNLPEIHDGTAHLICRLVSQLVQLNREISIHHES